MTLENLNLSTVISSVVFVNLYISLILAFQNDGKRHVLWFINENPECLNGLINVYHEKKYIHKIIWHMRLLELLQSL